MSQKTAQTPLVSLVIPVYNSMPYLVETLDAIATQGLDEEQLEVILVDDGSDDGSEKVLADEPFSYGEGITGWAVEHREPVLANRAELDPRVRFVADTTPDPESLVVVPLVALLSVAGSRLAGVGASQGPSTVAPLASARTPQQLAELLASVDVELSADELARLSA